MSFLTVLALGIALLVGAPYLAHRLRRQRAEETSFAAVRLVSEAPPKARRRSRLEDRALFFLRAASIVALAFLGASPLVRCSRLAMHRSGTSVAVAIVLDDSMSMRAKTSGDRSRFEMAKAGAREVLASLREGDAAAIVLAGSPARIGLAATSDIGAAKVALSAVTEADRGTDLDGALAMAKMLVSDLPQVDRRIVVLSDLADGKPDAPPLGANFDLPVWIAMPELAEPLSTGDCAVLSADRHGARVRVRFACSNAEASSNRSVQLKDKNDVVATAVLPKTSSGEVLLTIGSDDTRDLLAELTGKDAIAEDDRAPVVVEAGPSAIAIVNAAQDSTSTGGTPIVEQALAALRIDLAVRPLPQVPDRVEDMAPFAAVIVDDPPGFTPEQRRVLAAYVERGGTSLLALGRGSASAPLGANFEPLLGHAVTWTAPPPDGSASKTSPATFFGESLASFADLDPKGRVRLEDDDLASYDRVLDWSDGLPLVAKKKRGRGEVWLTTLPLSVDTSDFVLRPGFLALLEGFVRSAKERAALQRSDVGSIWTFSGAREVDVIGPNGKVPVVRQDHALRFVPDLLGTYDIVVDGEKERRVAAPVASEVDLRPRAVASRTTSSDLGGGVATVDVSWMIALLLLALVAGELVVRARSQTRTPSEALPSVES